ncbi:MAG: hypothetical protein LBH28_05820 [Oscillospiraceae bacterium]|jgi:hypothetical protein|nr:hypothetical protein [Oscillospiraceae bacterium]
MTVWETSLSLEELLIIKARLVSDPVLCSKIDALIASLGFCLSIQILITVTM